MKLKELECPKCGAPLRGAPTDGKLECQYCGTVFLIDSAMSATHREVRQTAETVKKPEAAKRPSDRPQPQRQPVKPGPVSLPKEPEKSPPPEPKKRRIQPWMIVAALFLLIAALMVFPIGEPKAAPQTSPAAAQTGSPAPTKAPEPTAVPIPTATAVPRVRDSYPDFGMGSTRVERPNYTGKTGYAAVSVFGLDFPRYMEEFDEADWVVTTYEKDKQFWNKAGTIPHKTPVKVIEQITTNKNYTRLGVTGYLLVETIDSHERFYISVSNFCTDPYWLYDVYEATATSYVVARYRQVSDYYPELRDKSKCELEDGTLVLCIGLTGSFGNVGPDNRTNQIETHVIGPICYNAFFNKADLTVVY